MNPALVCGNHDWAAVGLTSVEYFNDYAKKAVSWTTSNLNKQEKEYLKSLKPTYINDDMTLVHGTLMNPALFEYVFDLDTAYRMMGMMTTKVAFIGHSHVPGIFSKENSKIDYTAGPEIEISPNKSYLVNVGSVGQPRDGDWRAAFCIWDKDANTISIKRIEYDLATAQKKILDAGLPKILAQRLGEGR